MSVRVRYAIVGAALRKEEYLERAGGPSTVSDARTDSTPSRSRVIHVEGYSTVPSVPQGTRHVWAARSVSNDSSTCNLWRVAEVRLQPAHIAVIFEWDALQQTYLPVQLINRTPYGLTGGGRLRRLVVASRTCARDAFPIICARRRFVTSPTIVRTLCDPPHTPL